MESERDYTEIFRQLGNRYVRSGLEAWDRYANFVRGAAAGETGPEDLQKRYAEFVRQEGPDFVAKLIEHNLSYYGVLLESGLGLANRFVESVLRVEQPGAGGQVIRPRGSTPTTLDLKGRAGERAERSFVVANKSAAPVEVSFEITEFVDETGAVQGRLPVEFAPARFTLEPGVERVVTCALPIAESLTPGKDYRALVRVQGFEDMQVALSVGREAGTAPRAEAAALPGKATPGAKKAAPARAKRKAPRKKSGRP